MSRNSYIAYSLLTLAVFACASVGYFVWTIEGDSADRAQSIQNAEDSARKKAEAVRAHALANDTAPERARLTALASTDLLSVADLIEATGRAAGVTVELSEASPENAPQDISNLGIRPVGFVVQASGKFSSLMHAAELFENLPILSTIQRLDIEHSRSTTPGDLGWHMSIYIRVYTTADKNTS